MINAALKVTKLNTPEHANKLLLMLDRAWDKAKKDNEHKLRFEYYKIGPRFYVKRRMFKHEKKK